MIGLNKKKKSFVVLFILLRSALQLNMKGPLDNFKSDDVSTITLASLFQKEKKNLARKIISITEKYIPWNDTFCKRIY